MPYCIQCGHLAKDGESFCTACGAPIQTESKSQAKVVTVTKKKIHSFYWNDQEESSGVKDTEKQNSDFAPQEQKLNGQWELLGEEEKEAPYECGDDAAGLDEQEPLYWAGKDYQDDLPPFGRMDLKQENSLSVGGFLGSILALHLPIIGLILAIVWSCGVAKNPNRVNLAKAYLIIWAFAICAFCVAWLFYFSA